MRKRVLFFIESLSGGGAEKVLVTLLRHFNHEKYDITLLTVSDGGVHLGDVDFDKVHYKCIIPRHNGLLQNISYAIKYKIIYNYLPSRISAKLIIPSGFDTYVAFTEGFCTKIIGVLYNDANKVAYVHMDLKDNPWTQNLGIYRSLSEEQAAYKHFDTVVCVSHSVENIMKSYYGLTNTTAIYNPIDVEDICNKAKEPIEFTITNGFNIVSVGRLVYQKGYDLLIPIISRLRDEGIDVSLYILGEGEMRKHLENQIAELGLQNYVHLLGYKNNPYPIISKMDLFVCSSRAEGYSLVIAEALCLGVPVISTNCSGPNELLAEGKFGFLCNSYDELYNQIKLMSTNPSIKGELRENALKRKSFFDLSRIIVQVEAIL